MTRKNQGFTLVEILIVVIILGILAAVVIPQFTQASNDARRNAMMSDLQTVRSQLELYKVEHGSYPTDFTNQMTSKTNSSGTVGTTSAYIYGPYLQKVPSNPFVDTNSNTVDTTKGGGNAGWYYNSTTGEFCPDDNDHSDL